MLGERKELLSVYVDGVQFSGGLKMRLSPYEAVKLSVYPDAGAFVARVEGAGAFAPCRETGDRRTAVPVWRRAGKIQWKLSADGVLTVAKNADIRWKTDSIPDYAWDSEKKCSTAPWMPCWEKICSVVIANDVDAIGNGAFECCASLTAVTIPDSVTKIGDFAFFNCTSLTAVTIPDCVEEIGWWAFHKCPNLHRVEIPAGACVRPFAFGAHTQVIRRARTDSR